MGECRWMSLGQGNYAVDILKRFGMMDCNAMITPMASNLKILSDASSESVVLPPFTHLGGNMEKIFKPLGVSFGKSEVCSGYHEEVWDDRP